MPPIPEPTINSATLFAWYGESQIEVRFYRELVAEQAARIAELEAQIAGMEQA